MYIWRITATDCEYGHRSDDMRGGEIRLGSIGIVNRRAEEVHQSNGNSQHEGQ
jgi:hypothetical protein